MTTPSPDTKGAQPEQLVERVLGEVLGHPELYDRDIRVLATALSECREALRRLAVLMDYGYTIEHHSGKPVEELVALVSSNDRLEEWYGKGWAEQYVLDALAAQPPSEASAE